MRYIILLLFISASAIAQDTLFIKNGEVIPCDIKEIQSAAVIYTSPGKTFYKNVSIWKIDSVGGNSQMAIGLRKIITVKAFDIPLDTVEPTINPNLLSTETLNKRKFADHLDSGGGLLIGASSAMIVGALLSVIGATQDTPELIYAGAGVSGVSVFLLLGSGVKFKKAAQSYRKL